MTGPGGSQGVFFTTNGFLLSGCLSCKAPLSMSAQVSAQRILQGAGDSKTLTSYRENIACQKYRAADVKCHLPTPIRPPSLNCPLNVRSTSGMKHGMGGESEHIDVGDGSGETEQPDCEEGANETEIMEARDLEILNVITALENCADATRSSVEQNITFFFCGCAEKPRCSLGNQPRRRRKNIGSPSAPCGG